MTETTLYPLIFYPIFKEKIWGGNKIKTVLKKDVKSVENCGETWELSGVEGNVSIVKNGPLQGKTLDEIASIYQEKLLGKKVHQTYGTNFPLLVKFIDANADLSIQVHPDDALATKRNLGFGKSEMWYILQAEPDAKLINGFNCQVDTATYLNHLQKNTLLEILKREPVKPGDVFLMPAGRVHAIGKGVLLAEIQQSSDVTYRIYDYNRTDANGNKRELHTEQALDAIGFQFPVEGRQHIIYKSNAPVTLTRWEHFTVVALALTQPYEMKLAQRDSFTILTVVEGAARLCFNEFEATITMGDVWLLPAVMDSVRIIPSEKEGCRVLDTYIA